MIAGILSGQMSNIIAQLLEPRATCHISIDFTQVGQSVDYILSITVIRNLGIILLWLLHERKLFSLAVQVIFHARSSLDFLPVEGTPPEIKILTWNRWICLNLGVSLPNTVGLEAENMFRE